MIEWVKNLFKKKSEFVEFPKVNNWMFNKDLSLNIKNLKKCKRFYDLIGLQQDSRYHNEGDVWTHTIMVAKEMHKLVKDSSWFLKSIDKEILMTAALCHDLGKASSTTYNENSKTWESVNHASESERIARSLLFDMDINLREEICWLIKNHSKLFDFIKNNSNPHPIALQQLSNGYSTIEKLSLLYLADCRGMKYPGNTENKILSDLQPIINEAMKNDCYIRPFKKDYSNTKKDCNMYVMIGLPGSGKDTYIKKFLKHLPCICRDDIREEITDGQILGRKLYLDKEGETQVTNIVNERIKNCILRGRSFVINQTSLKKDYRDKFKTIVNQLYPKYTVNIIYVYVEAPSVEECITRRGGGKWNDIINNMWNQFEFPDKTECDELIIYKS